MIAAALPYLLRNWRLLALAAAAAFLALLFWQRGQLRAEVRQLQAEAAELRRANAQTVRAYEDAQAFHRQVVAVLEADRAAAEARAARTRGAREEALRAPATDDAPIAPVLRRALDGLRAGAPDGTAD
jgi:hypothetical protein